MKKIPDLISHVFFLILFVLAFIKSVTSSFTHDEAFTFLTFVKTSFFDIVTYKIENSNNHLINTILTKISYHILGDQEWMLRLPNVLSMIPLYYFIHIWMKENNIRWVYKTLIFSFVFLNPYMFDFFSLSRGYGLFYSFGLIGLMGLAYTKYISRCKEILYFTSLGLMVMSNFSTLMIFMSIICIYLISLFQYSSKFRIKDYRIPILSSIILLGIITKPLIKLKRSNQFYYGGDIGFYHDTILTLFHKSKYNVLFPSWVSILIITIVTSSIILAILNGMKNRWQLSKSPSFFILNVLIITLLTNYILHFTFGTKFLMNRTALSYYLLAAALVSSSLIEFFNDKKIKTIDILIGIPSTLMIFHFSIAFTFNSYMDWIYDCNSKNVIHKINELSQNHSTKTRISTTFIFEPSFNYYISTRNLDKLAPINRKGIQPEYDYYYIPNQMINEPIISGKNLIQSYPKSDTHLFKK